MWQLNKSDPRTEHGEKLLANLDGQLHNGAKKQGKHTQKSEAIEETKAQVRLCSDQHEAVDAALMRENERHYKAVEKIMRAYRGNHDELKKAAEEGAQTAEELLMGDPDEELGDPSEPATKRCRGDELMASEAAEDYPGLEEKIAEEEAKFEAEWVSTLGQQGAT